MSKITAMTSATSVADADLGELVQGGTNKKVAYSVIAEYIYAKKFIGTDFIVNTFADLPDATANSGKLAYVQTTTGTLLLLTRKTSGFYRSNGTVWSSQDIPFRGADSIWFDSTGLTNFNADDLQEALTELDAIITGKITGVSITKITASSTDPGGADGEAWLKLP